MVDPFLCQCLFLFTFFI